MTFFTHIPLQNTCELKFFSPIGEEIAVISLTEDELIRLSQDSLGAAVLMRNRKTQWRNEADDHHKQT